MLPIFQRFICWGVEKALQETRVGGISVYDLRDSQGGVPAQLMSGAATYLARAGDGFEKLVFQEIRMVVASRWQDSIYTSTGAYFTRLRGLEARSPLFLASRLVWIATYIGCVRARGRSRIQRRATEIECASAQLEFLDAVGEEAGWIQSLRGRLAALQLGQRASPE
jgi:hypothetical protein